MERDPILVTGGAGFIGSHTAKALHVAGYQPVVMDNLVRGHRAAVRWGVWVHADLGDAGAVARAFAAYQPRAVIHFAALAYVGESVTHPRDYFRTNVANTINLLDACLDHGAIPVVFSSSCATYGIPERVPIDESQPQCPINPYGRSKLFVEHMLRAYDEAYGLRSVSLRYFNAAGADPDGEIGEEHDPETHLVPRAILAALGRQPPLVVNGTDYPTTDGTAVRDYVHVSDLADAHVRALEYLIGGGATTEINLGLGRGFSVRDVVHAVERVGGRPVPSRDGPRRAGDPPVLVADPARAVRVLHWEPAFRDLDAMVRTAWAWLARHGRYDAPWRGGAAAWSGADRAEVRIERRDI